VPDGVFQIFGNIYTGVVEEKDPSEDSRLKQALFVSSWKRDFAAAYNVDVYSDNKVLQEQLNKVGWASAVAGLSVSGVLTPLRGPVALALKNTRFANQITEALKEEPPSRLRIINTDKLSEIGISEALIERFLDHPNFTPRHDTVIVAALADLTLAKGGELFLRAIISAQDKVAADFYMNIAQTMRGYNEIISPIEDIAVIDGMVIARANNGSALIPLPMDHGVWSKQAARVMDHLKTSYETNGYKGKYDLWVTGTVSPRARDGLAALDIVVTESVDERLGFLE
jgi:hypothetical protein